MGVPVMAHRRVALSASAASVWYACGFLMLCASSNTTRSHSSFVSGPSVPSDASVP